MASSTALEGLRPHQGTVWRWNRAIYDPAGGGHLRIEMRALAAMLERYLDLQWAGEPVHTWPLPGGR